MDTNWTRTIETRPECVIETWSTVGCVAAITLFSPGTIPTEDPEVEIPDGYLGSILPLGDGRFEADRSAGHAPPLGIYPTFDAALAAILT